MKRKTRCTFLFLVFAGALLSVAAAPPADFTLKEAGGTKSFTLSQAKGKYVALHFLLKTECPNSLKLTQTYSANASSLPNVEQVFIKPDTDEEILKWAGDLSPETKAKAPVIYRDPDAKL